MFPGGSVIKNLPAKQETRVQSLGWEDPLKKGMATHSSILAWRIPRTEKPGKLQSMELQKSWTWLSTKQQQTTFGALDLNVWENGDNVKNLEPETTTTDLETGSLIGDRLNKGTDWISLVAQTVKRLSTMWETWVRSLGWEDSLEEEMATHSSTLALKIPWTEELGAGYYPWGRKKSGTTERLHFHFLWIKVLRKPWAT